jgi:hypothetical protein
MKKLIEILVCIALAAAVIFAGKWVSHPSPPKPYDPTEGFIQKRGGAPASRPRS